MTNVKYIHVAVLIKVKVIFLSKGDTKRPNFPS